MAGKIPPQFLKNIKGKKDSKAEMAADKKKGIKPGSAADKKQDKGKSLPPWLKKGK
jgi:hypothetical protein